MKKSIFAYINAETEYEGNVLNKARAYEQNGADGLYLYNYDRNEQAQESFLDNVRAIMKQVDIPLYIGCVVKRFEDVKKALYTGHIGDGKIFVYNVENVVKVRTGEVGYDALQDVE